MRTAVLFRCGLFLFALAALIPWTRSALADAKAKDSVETDRITIRAYIAPGDPFDAGFKAGAEPVKVRRGQVVKLVLEGKPKPGFHATAALEPRQLKLNQVDALAVGPTTKESPERESFMVSGFPDTGHGKPFTLVRDLLILPEAEPGLLNVSIQLNGQACDEHSCKRFDLHSVTTSVDISPEDPLSTDKKLPEGFKKLSDLTKSKGGTPPLPPSDPSPGSTKPDKKKTGIQYLINSTAEQYQNSMEMLDKEIVRIPSVQGTSLSDLLAFIMGGIFWGAISLVTPCVFPMIPITVSIFLKQSEKEHHRPVVMALVYSGTIVVVLTLAAVFMLSVFRALSVNPFMNIGLGALFVVFALSLFGMYDIELPSGLARFTSEHESKGGYVGIAFMALTFTIISFACVAPFLGGFGGTAAGMSRPWWFNIMGGLAFSVTFASPFFFLALFPTLLRKLPKSGTWLNSVKVVMGFLELAAAVKFCRAAELVLTGSEPWLLTFDYSLGVYIALALLCGLYLLGIFRLPHDTHEEHLGVARMVLAGMFLALALYLTPGLMKSSNGENLRPRGTIFAWVESFLLPDASDAANEELHTGDLFAAVKEARDYLAEVKKDPNKLPKRIFIDFTGVNCTNCKINEKSVFTKHYVKDLFEPYIVVKLFTDEVPNSYYSPGLRNSFGSSTDRQKDDALVNLRFQKNVFDKEQLPTYVIIEPKADTIEVIGVYDEGRINNEPAFAKFLEIKPQIKTDEAK